MRSVVLALACAACGRIGFEVELDQSCAASEGGPCDDDDPCTTGDRCVLGVCGAGEVAVGCATEVTQIYRSIGPGTGAALVTGGGTLTISGTTAAISVPLPDRVGVGDVFEYDADGDGTRDSLAFVSRRLSSQVLVVRSTSGGTPTPTAAPSARWAAFRAYLSLAAAMDRTAGGVHNPNITAAFDGYTGGRDLVAANEKWHFACYDDGVVDAAGVEICSKSYTRGCAMGSWTTDPTHSLHIFTPVGPAEVGTSQRHDGTWGTGYRRSDGIIVYEGFVWLDGLSLQRATIGIGRSYYVETEGHGGDVWISNSVGWNTITGASKVFDVWDTGVPALGPTYTKLRWWNDVAYNTSTVDQRSGFYVNSNRADAVIANCTAYVRGGGAYYQSSSSRATLVNCLGYSDGAAAFAADDGFVGVDHSVSSDGSLAAVGGTANAWSQQVSFVDLAGRDLHLDPAARNPAVRGTARDLTTDEATPFADDLDGEHRSGPWDIGADQVTP